MTINLKQFTDTLREAKTCWLPEENHPISPYLLENLVNPFCKNRRIKLGDLDYSAFDTDDLDELSEYLGDLGSINNQLSGFNRVFCEAVPLSEARRAFC